jgi:signal transduction histidine kinase
MFTDITGRRQAELALRDANDRLEARVQERTAELAAAMHQLEQAHRAQRRFVADASHDLRTPLTVVRAELDLLLGSGMSDLPIGDSLRRALSEVHRLDTLATDLLTLATLDNDDSTSARERVRLDEMLLDSISNLTTVARDKQIAWNIEIEDAIELECHRASLQRAIGNVLDNALKFSPVGEVITVRFARTGGRACIVVSDCGIGIAPEELPRIYDRFYRSDAARHTQGTGLGLPIVKRVVEAHGGEVVVESEQGRGTSVTIALPVDRSSDA